VTVRTGRWLKEDQHGVSQRRQTGRGLPPSERGSSEARRPADPGARPTIGLSYQVWCILRLHTVSCKNAPRPHSRARCANSPPVRPRPEAPTSEQHEKISQGSNTVQQGGPSRQGAHRSEAMSEVLFFFTFIASAECVRLFGCICLIGRWLTMGRHGL
jgi:hypothetical protein